MYVVHGTIYVQSGARLTIEAGTVVKFYDSSARLCVYNGILAVSGSAGNPIYFTSYKDDAAGGDTNGDSSSSTPAAGNWNQLYINASSTIANAIVRYGGSMGNIYADSNAH